jgi:hypothetical protein
VASDAAASEESQVFRVPVIFGEPLGRRRFAEISRGGLKKGWSTTFLRQMRVNGAKTFDFRCFCDGGRARRVDSR